MKKKILCGVFAIIFAVFSTSIFAGVFPVSAQKLYAQCTQVPSDTASSFCNSFQVSVASCSPIKPTNGNPNAQYMQMIYNLMMLRYGTLETACHAQAGDHGTTFAVCMSQWTCYWHGGKSADPREPGLCSGTGAACTTLPPV
jgi:hypothetical protein